MSSLPIYQPVAEVEVSWKSKCFRGAERFVAVVLIISLSLVLFAIWTAILLLSRRSPIIAHKRVGQDASELWVLKFRTMWGRGVRFSLRNALTVEYIDDQVGPFRKSPNDLRVRNRFAQFCRRHSLDELPQIVNVLMGQMSFVGPRPVTSAEVTRIYGSYADEILSVRPGISGLWQISGRNRLSMAERRRLDLECVRQRSPKMYLRVLTRTLPEVFTGASAW